MTSRIVALGTGFITAVIVSPVVLLIGMSAYRGLAGHDRTQRFPPEELAIEIAAWVLGALVSAYVAQKISGAVTAVTSACLGMAIFAVNGIFFVAEAMPPTFWLAGSVGCLAASVVGAGLARSRYVPPMPVTVEAQTSPDEEPWGYGAEDERVDQQQSFADRTGQSGAMRAGTALLLAGGGLTLLAELLLPADTHSIAWGAVLSGCGAVWLWLTIRCPKCRARVVWQTFTTAAVTDAQRLARSRGACPKCGYSPP
jgi:hypothetical protein